VGVPLPPSERMVKEIVAPQIWRIGNSQSYHQHGMPARSLGLANQTHPRLGRRTPPLFFVARQAASHDVLPGRFSAHRPGYNVVVSQIAGILSSTTILALVSVPNINVFPRKTNGVFPEANKVQESTHSRQPDR
jgi:hypothetical protein